MPPPIVWIVLGFILFLGVPRLIPWMQAWEKPLFWRSSGAIARSASSDIAQRMSLGERLLFPHEGNPAQQQGTHAFATRDYAAAAQSFQTALELQRNDPEMVIYLNNARVGDRPHLQVAVSVPIGTNPNVAQELLRGVAQAQDEINRQGGIRGVGLQVLIANDDNDAQIAQRIAETLVNNPKILAVIGHNATDASLAAAPIYQHAGLVMISPTSFSNALSGFGDYIFRTVFNIQSIATPLAEYIIQQQGLQRIAVCYDSQAPDNVSFRDEFVAAFSQLGGQLASGVCDFAAPTFDPKRAIADMRSHNAQGILMAPHVDRIHRAIALVQANQTQLPLFGSPTFYTMQTLQDGGDSVAGLTISVPWFPSEPFASRALQRWGGMVNWRTANSYDAAQAVITGLQSNPTRRGLQRVLRDRHFSAMGATDSVQFLSTGDRVGTGILVQVVSTDTRTDARGLRFSQLQR
ncbi:ABC transporter substrate-binding protein [Leptolyngbya sp. AN02str]|uniref:ABC transporter substrate-binding protein n=1 Tax=Leptolyngbya sp. AN02str TaxID=3423363 RepID=UPI003D31F9B2